MKRTKILIPLAFLTACSFPSEGVPADESSSGFTDGDEESGDATANSATVSVSTSSATTSATGSGHEGSDSDSGSSDDTDPTFGDDATTTHGDDSTGEPVTDFALSFDGTSYGHTSSGVYDWSETDFTVEAWVEIKDPNATGIIIDTANIEFTGGWVFYLHNDLHALVFSFFDVPGSNNVVVGPAIDEIGVGWHHFAATKLGDSVTIHVDGIVAVVQSTPTTVSFDNDASWTLGGAPNADPDFHLKDAALDDIRVTGSALYQENFEPPTTYDDEPAILKLSFDEGQGMTVSDDANEIVFTVENPTWISGS